MCPFASLAGPVWSFRCDCHAEVQTNRSRSGAELKARPTQFPSWRRAVMTSKVATLCLILTTSLRSAAPVPDKPSMLEELRAAIQKELDRVGYGSMGVALVSRDRTIWAAGVGMADRRHEFQVKLTTDAILGAWRTPGVMIVGHEAIARARASKPKTTLRAQPARPEVPVPSNSGPNCRRSPRSREFNREARKIQGDAILSARCAGSR